MGDAYYFKHDSNAAHDPRIKQMRSVYGTEGYGLYWMMIEDMRNQANYKLPISGKYALTAYAKDYDVPEQRLREYIDDCVNEFHLFERDDNYLCSPSLIRRMQTYEHKAESARAAAALRWNKPEESEPEEQPQEPETPEEAQEEITKQTFGVCQNVELKSEEYNKLVELYGELETKSKIDTLSTYIASKGKKYKSHYATILNWANREKEEQPVQKTKIKVMK